MRVCGQSQWYWTIWQRSMVRRCKMHPPNIGGFVDCPFIMNRGRVEPDIRAVMAAGSLGYYEFHKARSESIKVKMVDGAELHPDLAGLKFEVCEEC